MDERDNPDLIIIIYANDEAEEIDEEEVIELNRDNESETEDIVFGGGVEREDDQEDDEEDDDEEDDEQGDEDDDEDDDDEDDDEEGDEEEDDDEDFGREINFVK